MGHAVAASAEASLTKSYEEAEALIIQVILKFRERYGTEIDFHSQFSEAQLSYLKICKKAIDPKLGTFETLLARTIYNDLISLYRSSKTKWKRVSFVSNMKNDLRDECSGKYLEMCVSHYKPDFSLSDFCSEISNDAALVVKMAVETPSELLNQILRLGGEARDYKNVFRQHLASIGWTGKRIAKAFAEIQGCLMG